MLLPHGKAQPFKMVNIRYLATNTTMNSSTYGFLPSKFFTVPIALSAPVLMCFCFRRPRAFFNWLKLRFFHDIKAEERFLELKKKCEDEERRRASVEDKLKKLELEQQGSAQEKGQLKTEIVRLTAALKKASTEADETQVKLRQEQAERANVQQERSKLQDTFQKLQKELSAYQLQLSSYQQQLLVRENEKKTLRNELLALQTKFNDQTTLLNDRTRELQGAQAFLSKADTLSGAEVIRLVDELNQEIMQTAAFISDSFDFARKPEHADEIKEASSRTSELIGPTMTTLLGTVQHGDDPLLIQVALQAATVEFSRWIIMSWDFDGLQAEQPLAEIYGDVRETGETSVYVKK
jgi:predicted  nucleic acid-binding Zn-ribbon protein